MAKPRVLLIQEVLQDYRAPIYRLMQQDVDLTLAYTLKNGITDPSIPVVSLPYFKVGSLIVHTKLYKILNEYDVVISQPHLSSIRLCFLQWLPRKFKLITWSIGVHATYNTPFDLSKRPSLIDWIFEMIQDGADACIFYMKETIDYWTKYKTIAPQKYFEAHNTVAVADFDKLPPFASRNSFLFVGTLYAQKGLEELIEAYALVRSKRPIFPRLIIVGNGPEKDTIKKQIKIAGLEQDIVLCGAIYDESILKDYFLNALLCISPKQAGLSVPKSLGYGCPFVTRPDAITGGERDNVIDGYNGVFYNTVEELAIIMLDSVECSAKYEQMSNNARSYYLNKCSPQIMAKGVLEAIRFVLGK